MEGRNMSEHGYAWIDEAEVEFLAEQIYTAYCEGVGGVAFNGDKLPDWKTFRSDPAKQKQANAWVAAAKVAMNPKRA